MTLQNFPAMNITDPKTPLRAEIRRLASSVPKHNYQAWGANTAAAYRKLCTEALSLVAKTQATEQQLNTQAHMLRQYWNRKI